jgi:DNA-binding response OmpR family regulator
LLVDDERDIRWTLATAMRQKGYEVTEATNGEEALECLQTRDFDVCVADVCMPGLGGFGLVAALRFGEGDTYIDHRNMPIVLLSGQVTAAERARALDAGVDEFLTKPIDPGEFMARIRAVLRRTTPRPTVAPARARTGGDLTDFGMSALAQAMMMSGRSARIEVHADDIEVNLDFHRGQVAHATWESPRKSLSGESAAVEAFKLDEGMFQILPLPPGSPRSVFVDTDGLMLRAATERDESGRTTSGSVGIDFNALPADE